MLKKSAYIPTTWDVTLDEDYFSAELFWHSARLLGAGKRLGPCLQTSQNNSEVFRRIVQATLILRSQDSINPWTFSIRREIFL
jgi:hypothetical protein